METWNREELYKEVWDQPLVRLAPKYGISAVALGKVCDKLQIPLPGRGYWTRKEFGKPVEQPPLPEGKNLPVVHRFKFPQFQEAVTTTPSTPPEAPTDSEYLRILAFVGIRAAWFAVINRKSTKRLAFTGKQRVRPNRPNPIRRYRER
jgi:hypothetical protein